MRLANLLQTKAGRLFTFSCLYLTEGIPWGFTSVAVVTQMRREGLGPGVIGAFLASLSLPYAWKWTMGPVVDVVYCDRLGRRRMWIVGAQCLMVFTLLAAMPVDFTTELKLFTLIIFVHNFFAATQDVAIDALACCVLKEEERGLANGLMFGASYTGTALGGGGALFLTAYMDFRSTYLVVAAAVLTITFTISIRLKERAAEKSRVPATGSVLVAAAGELGKYAGDALRAIFGSRAAFVAMVMAALPMGAFALSLQLQSSLAVELGLSNPQIANLNVCSGLLSAAGCVVGGWLSDRLGRRRMLAVFLFATAIPTVYLAAVMQRHDWIMPVDPQLPDRPLAASALVTAFWAAVLVYAVFQGLVGGTRLALFMDVTTPAVAATQFTAYMAMLNLVTAYSAAWQGYAFERWGYPITLVVDAGAGLVCILLLPWTGKRSSR